MPKDRVTSENRFFCYVEFESAVYVKKALKLGGMKMLNCVVYIDQPKKRETFTLFVKNLPYTADESEIKEVFSKFNLQSIRVPMEVEDRNRGFFFNELTNEREIKEILKQKFVMSDRKLYIDESKRNERRDRSRDGAFDRKKRFRDERKGRSKDFGGDIKYNNDRFKGNKRVKENDNRRIVFNDDGD